MKGDSGARCCGYLLAPNPVSCSTACTCGRLPRLNIASTFLMLCDMVGSMFALLYRATGK